MLVVRVHTLAADVIGASVVGELAKQQSEDLLPALQGCTHVVFNQGHAKRMTLAGSKYWSVPLVHVEYGLDIPPDVPPGEVKEKLKGKDRGKNRV